MGQYRVIDDLLGDDITCRLRDCIVNELNENGGEAFISNSKLERAVGISWTKQIEARIKFIIDSGVFTVEKGVRGQSKYILSKES